MREQEIMMWYLILYLPRLIHLYSVRAEVESCCFELVFLNAINCFGRSWWCNYNCLYIRQYFFFFFLIYNYLYVFIFNYNSPKQRDVENLKHIHFCHRGVHLILNKVEKKCILGFKPEKQLLQTVPMINNYHGRGKWWSARNSSLCSSLEHPCSRFKLELLFWPFLFLSV